MSYTHLSPEERHYIEIERKRGISVNQNEAFKDETGVNVKNLIGCALMT